MIEPSEVSDLLNLAVSVDSRVQNGKAAVAGWHKILMAAAPWLTYDLAVKALEAHYGDDTRPLLPADIIRGAAAIRDRLLLETPIPDPPDDLDVFNPVAWDEAVAAARAAILARQDPAAAMAEVARRYPRAPRQIAPRQIGRGR